MLNPSAIPFVPLRTLFTSALLVIPLAVSTTSGFAADIVFRKSTTDKVQGNIESYNKVELSLKVGKETVKVPANDVDRVEWDDIPSLKFGVNDEMRGKLRQANDRYNKLKADPKASKELLKAEITYLAARTLSKMAMAEPNHREAAIKEMDSALKTFPEHFRYYDSVQDLARLYLAKKDFANAQTTIELLSKAPWNEMKLAGRNFTGRIQLQEGKLDEANKTFEEVAKTDGAGFAETTRKFEAKCGMARVLFLQGKPAEALKVLDDVTEQGPPDDSLVQAEAYMLRGHCQQALNQPKLAALEYLHVDVLYSRETAVHAESLFNLSKMWKLAQLDERSNSAAAKLRSDYPDSDWARQLASGN